MWSDICILSLTSTEVEALQRAWEWILANLVIITHWFAMMIVGMSWQQLIVKFFEQIECVYIYEAPSFF